MSRKITEESINAFYNKKRFKKQNMEVYIEELSTQLKLHGHTIAILNNNGLLEITTCGYDTRTTLERLNGLINVHAFIKKGQLYLNGSKWDGEITQIF